MKLGLQAVALKHRNVSLQGGDVNLHFGNVSLDTLQACGHAEKLVGEQRAEQEGLSLRICPKLANYSGY